MLLFIVESLLLTFFAGAVLYTLTNSLSGLFYKTLKPHNGQFPEKKAKIAILIPAYKEDEVIISASKSMLALNYPSDSYDIFVIADQLKAETIQKLTEVDVQVVEVKFKKSTKAKSLNFCLDLMDENAHDLVVISDADNIFEKDYLQKVNHAYQSGSTAIQGKRVAKNMDSNFAILDAASEIINNHIFRKGPNALGLSASLIGSGMAFKLSDVKKALAEIKAVGGFDKVLQLSLIEQGHKITYLDDALVFDEKVDNAQNFKNQRRRWLSSQYLYLLKFLGKSLRFLLKGNVDYFNMAVLHNLFLPRVLNLGLLFMLAGLTFGLNFLFNIPVTPVAWATLASLYAFSLIITLPRKFFNKELIKAIVTLPFAFLSMLMLLFKLKGADKQFIHTKHYKTKVDNRLYQVDNGDIK